MNNCKGCGRETTNPKFCNKSCSAKFNNVTKPKRTRKQYFCETCNAEVGSRRKFCDTCLNVDWSKVTLGEVRAKRTHQANSRVRDLARKIYKSSSKPKLCCNCAYDKHYEVCHIKGINEFDDSASIAEVNCITNLMALCPNCHWELDNGLLTLEEILEG